MILLILVVVLWIAVLGPSAWRRWSERRGVGSIDYFHHQLERLEHAGPTPAYRLQTAMPGGAVTHNAGAVGDVSRPKLVLLRPTDDEDAADIDGDDGCHYERVGLLEAPKIETQSAAATETRAELAAHRRQQARLRTTLLLRCLAAVVLVTAVIGALPGLRLAWIFTGLTGIVALALVGLMGYAREVEAERRSRRAATALRRQWQDESDLVVIGEYGEWDDYDLPPQVASAR